MKGLAKIDWMEKEEWIDFLEFLRQNINDVIVRKKLVDLGVNIYIRSDMITITKNEKDIADIKKMGNRADVFVYPFVSGETLNNENEIIGVSSTLLSRLKHIWGIRRCHGE